MMLFQVLYVYQTETGVELVPDAKPIPWNELLKEIQNVFSYVTSTSNSRDWQQFLMQQSNIRDGTKQ